MFTPFPSHHHPFSSSSSQEYPPVNQIPQVADLVNEARVAFLSDPSSLPTIAESKVFTNLLLDKYLQKYNKNKAQDLEGCTLLSVLPCMLHALHQIKKEEPFNMSLGLLINRLNEMMEWEREIHASRRNQSPLTSGQLAEALRNKLCQSDRVWIPYTWTAVPMNHQLILGFIKDGTTYRWEIYNTGAGIDQHESINFGPKQKHCPRWVMVDIPEAVIMSPGFLEELFDKSITSPDLNATADDRVCDTYFNLALLSKGTRFSSHEYQKRYGEIYEFTDTNTSGTCVPQVLYAFILLTLNDRKLYSRFKHRLGINTLEAGFQSKLICTEVPPYLLNAALQLKEREATRYFNDNYLSENEYVQTIALFESYQKQLLNIDQKPDIEDSLLFTTLPLPPPEPFLPTTPTSPVSLNPLPQAAINPPTTSRDLTDLPQLLGDFIKMFSRISSPLSKAPPGPYGRFDRKVWNEAGKIRESIDSEYADGEFLFKQLFHYLPDINDPYWHAIPLSQIDQLCSQFLNLIEKTGTAGDVSGAIYGECLYGLMDLLVKRDLVAKYPRLSRFLETHHFGGPFFLNLIQPPVVNNQLGRNPVITDSTIYTRLKSLRNYYSKFTVADESNLFHCQGRRLEINPQAIGSNPLFLLLKIIMESNNANTQLTVPYILRCFISADTPFPKSFRILWGAYLLRAEPGLHPRCNYNERNPNFLTLSIGDEVSTKDFVAQKLVQRFRQKFYNELERFDIPKADTFAFMQQNEILKPTQETLLAGKFTSSNQLSEIIKKECLLLFTLNTLRFPATVEFLNKYKNELLPKEIWYLVKHLLLGFEIVYGSHALEREYNAISSREEQKTFFQSLRLLDKILTDSFILGLDAPAVYDMFIICSGTTEILISISKYLLKDKNNFPLLHEKYKTIITKILSKSRIYEPSYLSSLFYWLVELDTAFPSQDGKDLIAIVHSLFFPSSRPVEDVIDLSPSALAMIEEIYLINVQSSTGDWWKKTDTGYLKDNLRITTIPLKVYVNEQLTTPPSSYRFGGEWPLQSIFGYPIFTPNDAQQLVSENKDIILEKNTNTIQNSLFTKTFLTLFPKATDLWNQHCSSIDSWVNAPQIEQPIKNCFTKYFTPTKPIAFKASDGCHWFVSDKNIAFLIILKDLPNGTKSFNVYSMREGKPLLERNLYSHSLQHELLLNLPLNHKESFICTEEGSHKPSLLLLNSFGLSFSFEELADSDYRLQSLDFPGYRIVPTPFRSLETEKHVCLASPKIKNVQRQGSSSSSIPLESTAQSDDKLFLFNDADGFLHTLPVDEEGYPIGSSVEEHMSLLTGIAMPNNDFVYAQKLIHACEKNGLYTEKELDLFFRFFEVNQKDYSNLPEILALRVELYYLVGKYLTLANDLPTIERWMTNRNVHTDYVKNFRYIPTAFRLNSEKEIAFYSNTYKFLPSHSWLSNHHLGLLDGTLQFNHTNHSLTRTDQRFQEVIPNPEFDNQQTAFFAALMNQSVLNDETKIVSLELSPLSGVEAQTEYQKIIPRLAFALENADAIQRYKLKMHALKLLNLNSETHKFRLMPYIQRTGFIFLIVCLEDGLFNRLKQEFTNQLPNGIAEDVRIKQLIQNNQSYITQEIQKFHIGFTRIFDLRWPISDYTDKKNELQTRFFAHFSNKQSRPVTFSACDRVLSNTLQTQTEHLSSFLASHPHTSSQSSPIPIFDDVLDLYFDKRTWKANKPTAFYQLLERTDLSPSARLLTQRLVDHSTTHPTNTTEWVWRDCSRISHLKRYLFDIGREDKKLIDSEMQAIELLFTGNKLNAEYQTLREMYHAVSRYGSGIGDQYPFSSHEILKWIAHKSTTDLPQDLLNRIRNLLIFRIRYQTTQKALDHLKNSFDGFGKNKLLTASEVQFVELIDSCKQLQVPKQDDVLLLHYQASRGLVLREDQLTLLSQRNQSPMISIQAASGKGKSAVFVPLCVALQQRLQGRRCVLIVPDPLRETTYRELFRSLQETTHYRLQDFSFSRKFANLREGKTRIEQLFKRTMPEDQLMPVTGGKTDFQSLLLHYFEQLLTLEKIGNPGRQITQYYNLNAVPELEDALRHLNNNTKLICDEFHDFINSFIVLNYDYGEPVPLESFRWLIGLNLLSSLVKYNYDFKKDEITFSTNDYNANILNFLIDELVDHYDGIFDQSHDKPALKKWLRYNNPTPTEKDVTDFNSYLRYLTIADNKKILAIRAYIHVYIPRCLQLKFDSEYGPSNGSEYPCPYRGKEKPVNAQYARPEIKITLTGLMLFKTGLSLSQMRTLLTTLKSISQINKNHTPDPQTPTSSSSSSGSTYAATSSSSNESHVSKILTTIEQLFDAPIDSINPTSEDVVKAYYEKFFTNKTLVLTYLELYLFPTLSEGTQKLTANAQDVATVIFDEVIGVAATLNNHLLFPVDMTTSFDAQTDSDAISLLLDPAICKIHTFKRDEWLSAVDNPNTIALADPRDILKGVSNDTVAQKILERRKDLQGVVIYDSLTKEPIILYRDGSHSIYTPSIFRNMNLLVYYDGPHCTGSDFPLPIQGELAILVDRDISWTNYVQTAKRARNLKVGGQSIALHLTEECVQSINELQSKNLAGSSSLLEDDAPDIDLSSLLLMTIINEGLDLEPSLFPALTQSIIALFRKVLVQKLLSFPTNPEGILMKVDLVKKHRDLICETCNSAEYLQPGMILQPVSLSKKIQTMIHEYSTKHHDLVEPIKDALLKIQKRADALLSNQYLDISKTDLYSAVETQTQAQSQSQSQNLALNTLDGGALTPYSGRILQREHLEIPGCISKLLQKGEYSTNVRPIKRLSQVISSPRIPFEKELFVTQYLMNLITPSEKQFWGVELPNDSVESKTIKKNYALKLLKTTAAILEVEDDSGNCIWVLLSLTEANRLRNEKRVPSSSPLKRFVIRNTNGDIIACHGGENPEKTEQLNRILAQVAYFNTDDFLDQRLRPYFTAWLNKMKNVNEVEEFYLRMRKHRIYAKQIVVYESTPICELFKNAQRSLDGSSKARQAKRPPPARKTPSAKTARTPHNN